MSIIDGRLNHFKEVGIMESLTSKSSRWLRKVTSAGFVPLLLAQVLIALFCVPETLQAGTEIRREMTMEELREFLSGEEQLTVLLSEGGAVRGNGITILADSIRLDRITRATDGKRHAIGSETSIAIGTVKEIRVEKMRGSLRHSGAVGLGILGGCFGDYKTYLTGAGFPCRVCRCSGIPGSQRESGGGWPYELFAGCSRITLYGLPGVQP